ncbi:sirohydrochlorin chelatase, partial [Streptomyces sp. SID10244]|nr:sirohydrochlorin chelatase [Streptomyces sp. SID10244]
MSPVLVAHGTRNPHGVNVIAEIAEAVSDRIGTTRTAFVDVLGPTPAEVIADVDRPAVLVPAFLASGYHVRKDIPRHVVEAGRADTVVTRALGPDPAIAAVARLR